MKNRPFSWKSFLLVCIVCFLISVLPMGNQANAAPGNLLFDPLTYNAEYARVTQLSNGTIIATAHAKIFKSTDGGLNFTQIGNVSNVDSESRCCFELFAFPQQLGSYAQDTLLFAYTVMNDATKSLRIKRSTDGGVTWVNHSTPITSSPTWEPEFTVSSDGKLVLFFADERGQGGNQIISHIVSTDGGISWGSPVVDVQVSGARPGMPRVAKLGNGTYMMSYEICGSTYSCKLYYKTSSNGLDWGVASTMGTQLVSSNGSYATNTTFIAWTPEAGNPNGMVIIGGTRTRNSGGTVVQPQLFINRSNGSGAWELSQTPFDIVNGGGDGLRANYSSDILPTGNGSKILMVASSWVAADNRTKMFYGTKTWDYEYGGELLSNKGFESGSTSWSSNATMQVVTSPVNSGANAIFMSGRTADWNGIQQQVYNALSSNGKGNYHFEAYLRVSSGKAIGRVELSLLVDGKWISATGVTATVTSSGYTKLSGIANVSWNGTLQDAFFKINTVGSTVSLYADDVSLKKMGYIPTTQGTQALANRGFESGMGSWSSNATLQTVTSPVQAGSNAAKMTIRSADWHGIQQNVFSTLNSGGQGQYYVQAYLRSEVGSTIGRVELSLLVNGTWVSGNGLTATVTDSGYTRVSGIVPVSWSGTLQDAMFKMNTVGSTVNLLADEASFIKQ